MALNPFFLQGSQGEQRLVQDLINEQLKIYGVEVYYLPRKYIGTNTIIKENVLAKFDDNFAIEAYVQNFDGFQGAGDLMTKFGVRTTDELTLIISKERFEDFVTPFLTADSSSLVKLSTRPKEGDLIYFPLSDNLFEIKFVEHEQPFYQLNKTYVYEVRCELFEYEDEVIDTTVAEIDDNFEDKGYIATLNLVGLGNTATVTGALRNGSVHKISLVNDGSGYTSVGPVVSISTSPNGATAANATAVAITTTTGISTTYSIKEIQIINPGYGYTIPPTVTFTGGGGSGAIATAGIGTTGSVYLFEIGGAGSNYTTIPTVSITTSPDGRSFANATAVAVLNSNNGISTIRFTNAGFGYTQTPTITIGSPSGVGTGAYYLNEVITGESSLTTARVKSWDDDTKVLKVSNIQGAFNKGEIVVGSATSLTQVGFGTTGRYSILSVITDDQYDTYAENITIENEADNLLDFTESNPFGTF